MAARYRRRIVEVEAWQHDDAGEAMPFWVAQILDHRDRAGVLVFKAESKVPNAALGDYVLLHEDGQVEVMDPGTFGVEFKDIAAEIATAEHQGGAPTSGRA